MPSLTIVIPAYNEEQSLTKYLQQVIDFCKQKNYKLIVVNDGSKDGTANILNALSEPLLKTVHNKVNRGYGGAIKAGIRQADTDFVVTIDADGQHNLDDVEKLFLKAQETDADMVVGNRGKSSGTYRNMGKWLIRKIAGILMPLHITDINSGMKLYNTALAKKYLGICPDTMAYSDIILLAFIYKRHLVTEIPVTINPRTDGKSTINTMTAVDTVKEIMNIVILFNPMRVFFPVGTVLILVGIAWDIPIFLRGGGISVGAMLGIITGITFYFFGLLAQQISAFRREALE